jgi:hypothetical protein
MTARLAPLVPFLRSGTTRPHRIRIVWLQFLLLVAVLCVLAGALGLVVGLLLSERPAPAAVTAR